MVQMDMQLLACSPVKAEVQLVLNGFHHFSFAHDTFTVSVHATAHINRKLTLHSSSERYWHWVKCIWYWEIFADIG